MPITITNSTQTIAKTCSSAASSLMHILAAYVLLLVIFQILAALDRAPPRFVHFEPLDQLDDAALEGVLRLPAQLALRFARIDRVTPVVARTVLHIIHRFVP